MKLMNRFEGLMQKVAGGIGMQLERMAADPRSCWLYILYEPETPQEIIAEMLENQ